MRSYLRAATAIVTTIILSAPAWADDTVKIGLILPMTGPFQSTGKQIDDAVKLWLQQHGDTVAGKKVQVILRDDAGVADTTRRLAQEMVVQDHVSVLAGFGLTPLALAVAPLATQAKVPEIVIGAGTSSVTERSPFIVRTGQTVPQVASVIGTWAAKHGIGTVDTLVTDYGPGIDAETWFEKAYTAAGGKVIEKLRVPLANPDFAPFLQHVSDDKPQAVFVFTPSGVGAVFIKQFVERGLDKSGIKLIAMGDVTDDDILNGMGDVVQGVVTGGPYSAAHPSETNKDFVTAFEKVNGGQRPNFMAVFGYDAMHAIYAALQATSGSTDGTKLVDVMKGMSWESPRGPISIDPKTRDTVQNIYMRRVEKQNGQLYNVEFETVPNVRDPAKP